MTIGFLDRLNHLSKSAIRGFYGVSCWTYFQHWGVRPLLSVMAQKIVLFVHRSLTCRCSNLFLDHFVPVNSQQTHGCSQQLLVIPFWPVPMVERQSSSMVVSWYALPAALHMEENPHQFPSSSSARYRVPDSLNCRLSSQLSNYRKVTLLLVKAQHATFSYQCRSSVV